MIAIGIGGTERARKSEIVEGYRRIRESQTLREAGSGYAQ